jgi:hypothetical protein
MIMSIIYYTTLCFRLIIYYFRIRQTSAIACTSIHIIGSTNLNNSLQVEMKIKL